MLKEKDFFDAVVGGREIPQKFVREDVGEPPELKINSDLDRRVARLLALHPRLRLNFRNNDLTALDDETKRTLLADMYRVLGVTYLQND